MAAGEGEDADGETVPTVDAGADTAPSGSMHKLVGDVGAPVPLADCSSSLRGEPLRFRPLLLFLGAAQLELVPTHELRLSSASTALISLVGAGEGADTNSMAHARSKIVDILVVPVFLRRLHLLHLGFSPWRRCASASESMHEIACCHGLVS